MSCYKYREIIAAYVISKISGTYKLLCIDTGNIAEYNFWLAALDKTLCEDIEIIAGKFISLAAKGPNCVCKRLVVRPFCLSAHNIIIDILGI